MKKYVFKDRAVENAFRLIAKALDIENFDEQFKESLDNKLPYISFYIGRGVRPQRLEQSNRYASSIWQLPLLTAVLGRNVEKSLRRRRF